MTKHITIIAILSVLLLLIMANNIPHGAELYAQISQRDQATIEPIYQGYFVMALFDIGVLVMIFCGDKAVSVALSIFLFVANIFFWHVPEQIETWQFLFVGERKLICWKIALSGMFSFLLHRFSETIRQYVRLVSLTRRTKRRQSEALLLSSARVPEVSRQPAISCENCGRSFASQNSKNAHKCKPIEHAV